MKRERIYYYDILRFMAILVVIFVHVCSLQWDEAAIGPDWIACHFWNAPFRWAVQIFVMISGAIFLDDRMQIDTGKLYKRNILRLLTAYVFWSFLYTVYFLFIEGDGAVGIRYFFHFFFNGAFHMWFIPMMLALYIFLPVLKGLGQKERCYLLSLSIVLTVIVNTLSVSAELAEQLTQSETLNKITEIAGDAHETFFQWIKVGYLPYFLLGDQLSRRTLSGKQRKILYALSALSVAVSFFVPIAVTFATKTRTGTLYDTFALNNFILSIGVFVLVRQLCDGPWKPFCEKHSRILSLLSDAIFGIYLSHLLFVYLGDSIFHYFASPIPFFLLIPLVTTLIFVIAFPLTLLIRRIPVIGKYIV